jgi:chondroitin AC lyase
MHGILRSILSWGRRKTGCRNKSRRFHVILVAVVALPSLLASVPSTLRAQDAHDGSREVSNDLPMIHSRLQARFAKASFAQADAYLSSQRADGSWSDINYLSTDAIWAPIHHMDRLQQMSIAFWNPNSRDFHSFAMLQGISRGLNYWYENKPRSSNWWYNQVGQQLVLEKILILAGDSLSNQQISIGAAYLHGPEDPGVMQKLSGQNLVWFAEEQLIRGVLSGESRDIAAAALFIENTISIKAQDGFIQPDYSFHQHGNLLYNGGYGKEYLIDCITFASILEGTRFSFPRAEIELLSEFLLQGTRFMVRGHMLDYGAIGREIARKEGGKEADGLIDACEQLAELEPDKAEEFNSFKKHIQGAGASYSFLGHKHFWNSDFSVHQRDSYYTSVKMNSTRTNGTESINGENTKGYWLPYGVTYIVRRGDEYAGIFPVWDWAHLPGVTSPVSLMNIGSDDRQPGTFVGGVSNGTYGASAMDLELPSIHAHKAWFYFDNEFVALGTGIASYSQQVVNTTLNQTLLKGDVYADGKVIPNGDHFLTSVSWLLHDGVGYILNPSSDLTVRIGPQFGSWGGINVQYPKTASTSQAVLSVWINHGIRPKNASYEYIVVPGTDEQRLSEYANHPPVHTIVNSEDIQAVRHETLGISQVVFYSPGHLILSKQLKVTVDEPCIVQIREMSKGLEIAASSPVGPTVLHLKIEMNTESQDIVFNLPGAGLTGSSVIKTLSVKP